MSLLVVISHSKLMFQPLGWEICMSALMTPEKQGFKEHSGSSLKWKSTALNRQAPSPCQSEVSWQHEGGNVCTIRLTGCQDFAL